MKKCRFIDFRDDDDDLDEDDNDFLDEDEDDKPDINLIENEAKHKECILGIVKLDDDMINVI